MRASALRSTAAGTPDPSLPTSNAEASHQSTSHGARNGCSPVSGSCTLDASILNPATFNCVIKIGSGVPDKTARCSAAPADARNALGENGLAVPLCPDAEIAAPVAPKAAAVRKIVHVSGILYASQHDQQRRTNALRCAHQIIKRRNPRLNQRRDSLRMLSVRQPFKKSVRRLQHRKSNFRSPDKRRQPLTVSRARIAEQHRIDTASRT